MLNLVLLGKNTGLGVAGRPWTSFPRGQWDGSLAPVSPPLLGQGNTSGRLVSDWHLLGPFSKCQGRN